MANTSAPLSEVAICNMAGDLLEDVSLVSLDDPTPFGRFCAREFGYIRDETLAAFPHSFAKTRALLASTTAPAFDWTYAYIVPDNCLRPLKLRADGVWEGGDPAYEFESGQILTDVGPVLKLIYVRKETNAAKFHPHFARVLSCRIALYACNRVTGKMGYVDRCKEELKEAIATMALVDSLQSGTPESYGGGASTFSARYPSTFEANYTYQWGD